MLSSNLSLSDITKQLLNKFLMGQITTWAKIIDHFYLLLFLFFSHIQEAI